MRLTTYIPTKDGFRLVRINIHSFFHERMRDETILAFMVGAIVVIVAWALS